jgi:hypothetical protein
MLTVLIQPNAKPGDIKFLKKEGNTGTNNNDFVNLGIRILNSLTDCLII